jgi:integrase/recombinase XerD
MKTKKRKQGQAEVITLEDMKKVIQYQKGSRHSQRNVCLIYLSVFLGMRVGEIASLKLSDIFSISSANDLDMKEQVVLRKEYCKGNKTRTIYISAVPVQKAINDYCEVRTKGITEFGKKQMDEAFILSQKKGHFSANALQMLYKKMYMDIGLGEMFSSHSGRRTFISNLIASGINLKSVSTLAGHSSITTTCDIYAKTNPIQLNNICKDIVIR